MISRGLGAVFFAFLLSVAIAGPREFEIAAVKPHAAAAPCGESNTYAGGRLVLSCFTLVEILREALDLQPGQSDELTGGPGWVRTELWDITAKAEGVAGELTPAEYRGMLLSLAEGQFQLKLRKQKQEVKGLELTRDQKSKLRPGLVLNSGAPRRFDLKPGISLTAQRISMKEFAAWLKMPMGVGHRVKDNTGLPGQYDFVLKWAPQRADGTLVGDGPTIFTALKEQLGLRLRPARVLADVYTIEAAQRPQE
jgi:uncharacterized protein (TIGR03435 family)